MGHTTSVVVTGGDLGVHQHMAKSLLTHVESGNKIKTLPDGSPKVGAFTSKTVKLAAPFFNGVKVNGVPAVTSEQLAAFIDWADATRTMAALEQAWPVSVQIPDEDTLAEKLQWHRTEVAQLDKVLALGDQLELERSWFHANKLPTPDWNNLDDIRRYAALVEAAAAADSAAVATSPLAALDSYLRAETQWPNAPAATRMLLSAVEDRDLDAYVSAHGHLVHLHQVAEAVSDRDRVRAELDRIAPRLAEAIAAILLQPSGTTDCRPSTTRGAGRLPAGGSLSRTPKTRTYSKLSSTRSSARSEAKSSISPRNDRGGMRSHRVD
jgi:hypothetical protein